MEKAEDNSCTPLVICLDSPGAGGEGQKPLNPSTSKQTSPDSGMKRDDFHMTSVVITPTGLFPSAFVPMDTGDNDLINSGVYLHLKRPPFENCVRLFRSKFYEIAKLPESAETPELAPYQLRQWKESICRLIGLDALDTRKLNDCYKHDMKTARSPQEAWKEIDTLFNLWRKKEINGQVKDTLKQTQFKIINAVSLPRRVELLRQINRSKITWQKFLDLCKEDIRPNQSNSSLAVPDTDEVTCTSDAEEEVLLDKTPVNQTNKDTSQLSGQVEDLVSKVKIIEKKWMEAERRANNNECRARELSEKLAAQHSTISKLKFVLSKQQQKNLELSRKVKQAEKEAEANKTQISRLQQQLCVLSYQESEQGDSTESRAQQNRIHAEALRLKSLELAAKNKEIEMLKVQKSAQLRICEAELAFKSALLEAREKEVELQQLKAEHTKQRTRKRRVLEEEEANLPFSVQSHCSKVESNQGNKDRATDQTLELSHHGNKPQDVTETNAHQLRDLEGTDNSAATTMFWESMIEDTDGESDSTCNSPYPVSVKRIKVEPQD